MAHDASSAGQELVEGRSGQFLAPSLEEQIKRLQAAVALLATELDLDFDRANGVEQGPRRSVEEQIERTLYPEHFL
jgi:hypothetical protein